MSRQIKTQHTRSLAVLACDLVIHERKPLGDAIETVLTNKDLTPQDRGFIQTLSFGVVRWYWQLEDQLNPLLSKPIKNKERLVKYIILIGIFQIQHLKTPAHAAVSDTVECCQQLDKQWAKNLVNGCLRNYIRSQEKKPNLEKIPTHYAHPKWMIDSIGQAWPEHKKAIFSANNQAAPLCIRVNKKYCTRDEYLVLLDNEKLEAKKDPYSPIGIRLAHSLPVNLLPKFAQGWVSIQDTASQMIAQFIEAKPKQRILDACAAPGGKTSLILESSADDVVMHALDINSSRNTKLNDTLHRLNLKANVIHGDASKPQEWWDGEFYQRILVDAPCSGLGVIRRHPDIKHLRQKNDLTELHQSQSSVLSACWNLLEPNGFLLYTTCSILPSENEQQIDRFLTNTPQAEAINIHHPSAIKLVHGVQSLPGISDMDGFYYCLLHKLPE